ncbi:MAG TPA: hypothetical protein PLC22_00990 [Gordonia sp. (in: high G+C Gram-positive bacteria)]|jgi:hypothetical protein|nr:hypothetical protein [Gordonia sp. (in: high G+C Gram-positive bacteria)]
MSSVSSTVAPAGRCRFISQKATSMADQQQEPTLVQKILTKVAIKVYEIKQKFSKPAQ